MYFVVCVFVCVEIFSDFEKLSVVSELLYSVVVKNNICTSVYICSVIVRFISVVNSVIIKGTFLDIILLISK